MRRFIEPAAFMASIWGPGGTALGPMAMTLAPAPSPASFAEADEEPSVVWAVSGPAETDAQWACPRSLAPVEMELDDGAGALADFWRSLVPRSV